MAKRTSVRIDGLADPELELKLAAVRAAPSQATMSLAPHQAIMEPTAVIPRLRRMQTPFKQEQVTRAVVQQALKGTMGGLPLQLNGPPRKKGDVDPLSRPYGFEQGFYYDWDGDFFGIAPLTRQEMVNGEGRNTFAYRKSERFGDPNVGAYIHTHPAWSGPQPGSHDASTRVPMFIIHRDRISEIPVGEREAKVRWPLRGR